MNRIAECCCGLLRAEGPAYSGRRFLPAIASNASGAPARYLGSARISAGSRCVPQGRTRSMFGRVKKDASSKSTSARNAALRSIGIPRPALDLIGVAGGAFADPSFPQPTRSFWEATRHAWVAFEHEPERFPQQPALAPPAKR